MYTTETAPKGYAGPVRLTAEQRAHGQALTDAWTLSLIEMARDESDPESAANARLLLTNRGIAWESMV